MSGANDRPAVLPEGEWARVWQEDLTAAVDAERIGRRIMAQVWRFDQKIFWRNFREYAAGITMLAVFVGQLVMGADRVGALIGIGGVGFVMVYLWWKHRGLQPLDPAADVATYRLAMVTRIDDQIRLLRTVAYWYLLPIALPMLWQVARAWNQHPRTAGITLIVDAAFFVFVWWLNVVAGVRALETRRGNITEMFPRE
jgi:hypothetical protein